MKDASGKWVGLGLGDVDPAVAKFQSWVARAYAKTAGGLVATGTFDEATAGVVKQLQENLIASGKYSGTANGILNYATQVALGYVKAAPKVKPVFVTVEGHMSDMWSGPVADTAHALSNEGRVYWQPIGYNSNALPFDNRSGVEELARIFRSTTLDDGTPFPAGTKSIIGGFSQGGIVVYDFVTSYLLPGQELAWRTPDVLGQLAYGNPNRQTGSIAPWSVAQAGDRSTGGLDPKRRYGLPGNPDAPPFPLMDVWRRGDIFTDNETGRSGQVKAAVYEAVARSDFFGNEFSILAAIADLFKVPLEQVVAIFQAIISGIKFLASGDAKPHYSPFDISGGLNWARSLLS
jgi:peptidoglycan hydrolase-like protein with peptidoglycan-binding domain